MIQLEKKQLHDTAVFKFQGENGFHIIKENVLPLNNWQEREIITACKGIETGKCSNDNSDQ